MVEYNGPKREKITKIHREKIDHFCLLAGQEEGLLQVAEMFSIFSILVAQVTPQLSNAEPLRCSLFWL